MHSVLFNVIIYNSGKLIIKFISVIFDHASSYRNGSKSCNLCLTEKFHIITSKLPLLNKRSELISKCRHVNKFLLSNYKSVPPD